ncbi:SpoIVB peptidase S55 [Friedmanniella luteola]|uniref:SpoIVB peptidase S55 n=1 Tax=Friedmanniella luteola TaxID=546871 RepID=A0A1H1ZS56_9ACTN|nr:SpoIVB peptidase S55 domain-containing protein [Friedmanniella luteola]SDT36232.1 SpoIVB peptidase S55 [Friedmanniella luteola]
MQGAGRRRWQVRSAGAGLAVALVAGVLATPAAAEGPVVRPAAADPCPAVVPVAEVTPGLVGEGLTVVRGTTPKPFAVEVLGVLPDGIGAGKDMIVVEVSDLAGGHVVDQGGGGIWAGMSGSPVYVGGRLLGSVSYGFTSANSPIGGVTPAADMLDLLDLGRPAVRAAAAVREPRQVALPSGLRRQVDARAAAAVPRGGLQRLPVPLSLSGLGPARVARFQAGADAAGLSVLAHAGSGRAAPAASSPLAVPVPGGNFTSVLSYGDVTVAGTGTTTAVCGGQALAFGHPYALAGAVSYGASTGSSLAIIRDDTFGAFKLATVGDPVGTVDQDRTSGLRARLGVLPMTVPVTTTVRNSTTGAARTGTTRVSARDLLPEVAAYAALANYDNVVDEIGDGRASSRWVITGTRAGGTSFTVSRTNAWASRDDIAAEPAFDLAAALDALVDQDDEAVTIRSVALESNVTGDFRQYRVGKTEVAVGKGAYKVRAAVTVKAGDTIKVRTTLKAFRSSTVRRVVSIVKVPAKTQGKSGLLLVAGGQATLLPGEDEGEGEGCFLDPTACDEGLADDLDAVIKGIVSAPHNDDLQISLLLGSEDDEDVRTVKDLRVRQRYTVTGAASVGVQVRR